MNLFRMTPDGALDRQYLRICAVYRATKRYGMDRETALVRLTEKGMRPNDARALYEIWPHT